MAINNYILSKKLGSGAFGKVYLGFNSINAERCAIKQIKNEQKFKNAALKEIKILKELKELEDYDKEDFPIIYFKDDFIDNDIQYLVFEFMKINLYNYYKNTYLNIEEIIFITRNVTLGLKYIHSLNIIHCDLKPENIMITQESNKVKIIDLGSAKYEKNPNKYFYIQSRYYRAPEVIFEFKYKCQIDIWSLGCIIYELLFSYPLFPGKNVPDIVNLHTTMIGVPNMIADYYNSKWFKYYFKWDMKNNIYLRNISNPRKTIYKPIDNLGLPKSLRRKLYKVKKNIKENIIDLLLGMIEYDSEKRLTASDILNNEIFQEK
jgi:dual specificity protein kinase YAK1